MFSINSNDSQNNTERLFTSLIRKQERLWQFRMSKYITIDTSCDQEQNDKNDT
jgi:hypothetical protein